jgi:hypothetical protein
MFSDSIYDIFPQDYYINYENESDKRIIPKYSTSVINNDNITIKNNDNTLDILEKSTPNTYYDLGVKKPNNASIYGNSLIPDTRITNDIYNGKFSNFENPNNQIVIQPIVFYFIMFICFLFILNCYQTNKLMKKMIKHNLIQQQN